VSRSLLGLASSPRFTVEANRKQTSGVSMGRHGEDPRDVGRRHREARSTRARFSDPNHRDMRTKRGGGEVSPSFSHARRPRRLFRRCSDRWLRFASRAPLVGTEASLLLANIPTARRLAHFTLRDPLSSKGSAALASSPTLLPFGSEVHHTSRCQTSSFELTGKGRYNVPATCLRGFEETLGERLGNEICLMKRHSA
jgi:hypothetical protein